MALPADPTPLNWGLGFQCPCKRILSQYPLASKGDTGEPWLDSGHSGPTGPDTHNECVCTIGS
eukprot:CAMPEP_0174366750 /NCGR_PEP_ID=MMETSP0811_2-20130205/82452_1 /TAXON_ID=73025 ORGANISM="Eutreptiella gymnastica-like, Strain CCMP1594" /NCGR_SAMPLE_ID=MMETSP0811_2 /ASSEMBLY_ACC=CAM_ASM_000667 /LENGTH=62 /DNA_ID=CAMNT_0015508611 /DNA_START=421 /DNA_END=606 /DNA_ORIENTATION=+